MKAVIVAGGIGERLRPITNNMPKPMVGVKGKPILLHIINLFKKNGVTDFIIALCYLPNIVTDFFGDGTKFGVNIKYTYEDPQKPLGTAGAISLAEDLIDDTFIVTSGDILRDLDVRKMINFHKKNKAFATLNIYERESKGAKSKVLMDKKNRITKFIERPKVSELKDDFIWVNGSFYIFESEIFKLIPKGKKSDFGKDIFPKVINMGKRIFAYPSKGYLVDIGNLHKLEYARKTFSTV